jgi:hypothetical protein
MCGTDPCPQPPAKPTPPAPPATSTPSEEEKDALPGANLLTADQVSQIQQQFPSRRTALKPTARTVAVVPYSPPTPQVFNPGQGSLTDRTVPDPARQQRMVDVQKSICTMVANDPKRPEVCNSLPK